MNENKSRFSELDKVSLSDQVVVQIQQMIQSGKLKPGDKLPSERKLCQQFNISRLPLREALKSLQSLNTIETRTGDGYYVKGLETASLVKFIEDAADQREETLESWREARLTIELAAVEFACSRRTDEDIANMKLVNQKMLKALSRGDKEQTLIESINFHNTLMEASKNRFFKTIMDCFKEVQYEGRMKTLEVDHRYEQAVKEHMAITEAIVRRDTELAKQLIRDHLATAYSMK